MALTISPKAFSRSFANKMETGDCPLRMVVIVVLMLSNVSAYAQAPGVINSARSRATIQLPGTNTLLALNRNALGKPCLDYEAISQAHITNPNLFDNVVSAKNQCAKRISVKICYYGSEVCVDLDVPPFQRRDVILGVRPQSRYFKYSYKEKL